MTTEELIEQEFAKVTFKVEITGHKVEGVTAADFENNAQVQIEDDEEED